MPRFSIDLNSSNGQADLQGQWKYAQGYVPGEPNHGLAQGLEGSPARLPDYDDSGWASMPGPERVGPTLTLPTSRGFLLSGTVSG